MESFIFAISAVLPLIFMVAIGYVLKRIGMITSDFVRMANKLSFRLFLPAMLFLNVYKIENASNINLGYVFYAFVAVLAVFVIVAPITRFVTVEPGRRGVFLQASFRSNFALVGVPLALALFGERGVAAAALLSSVSIPVFNILAVISLSIFSRGKNKTSIKKMIVAIAKNPLIIATLLGLACVLLRGPLFAVGVGIRLSDITVIYKVVEYLSQMATPLALIVLGAQFEFSKVGQMKREIVLGTLIRVLIVPIIALGIAYVFFRDVFAPEQFAALVSLFATPVAVSTVPMAQEMDGDTVLAGQLVVWTTLLSAFTIVAISFFFRFVGIF